MALIDKCFFRIDYLILIGLVIGCSNTPIDPTVIDQSSPEKITVTSRDKPSFQARSTTYDFFSILGEIPVYHEGKRIVSENGIENPADYIGQEIAKTLSNKFNIRSIETSGTDATRDVYVFMHLHVLRTDIYKSRITQKNSIDS